MVATIFEATTSREQAARLAGLMHECREGHPAGVLSAALTLENSLARLTAYWKDRDALDRHLSVAVPCGTELMRRIGVEPRVKIVEVLEFA